MRRPALLISLLAATTFLSLPALAAALTPEEIRATFATGAPTSRTKARSSKPIACSDPSPSPSRRWTTISTVSWCRGLILHHAPPRRSRQPFCPICSLQALWMPA
jgi:hypothetical protein